MAMTCKTDLRVNRSCLIIKQGMPRVKPGTSPPVTNRQLEEHDNEDDLAVDDTDDCNDVFVANAVVKMKLNSFSTKKQLNTKIRNVVFDMNQVLGEAYTFANFHLLRILHKKKEFPDVVIPVIDRNFYYRCIVAIGLNKCRGSTLDNELEESKKCFDLLRDPNIPKVVLSGHIQVLADLSISMTTMAKNHLWLNIAKRLLQFLSWSQPTMKPPMRKRIVDAILYKPTIPLTKLFPNKDPKEQEGLVVATELRAILTLTTSKQQGSSAHLLIPLYFHILEKTVEAKKVTATGKKFAGRTFTLLPMKNGYTINNIQFSTMALLGYIKAVKLEKFQGDGRDVDASKMLRKYFNVNLIETKHRIFGNRITTDGVAVSIFIKKKCALICPNKCPCEKKLSDLVKRSVLERDNPKHVRVVSADPGFTDVAVTRDHYGNTNSYSSAKYYEKALYNMSRRRINKWNETTVELTRAIPCPETDSFQEFRDFTKSYLLNLVAILKHRFDKGYRNMRFLRYTSKNIAINEICEMIAPRDEMNVVGFGNWNGGKGTPIKRRCAGPLQEIKLQLDKMKNTALLSIDEYLTSQTCSNCENKLSNMKAQHYTYKKVDGKMSKVDKGIEHIHKILHCRSRQVGKSSQKTPSCGTTWNRDVNASINILNLTFLLMQGLPRPKAMTRKC